MKTLATLLLSLIAFTAHGDPKDMKEMVPPAPLPPSDAGFFVAIEGGAFAADADSTRVSDYWTKHEECCHTVYTRHESSFTDHAGWGFVGGAKGGYNFASSPVGFGSFALALQPSVELEGLYLTNNSYDAEAGFVNGAVDFKNSSIVTPFIGAGVGVEHFDGRFDCTDFAVDAFAGLKERFAAHWSVFEEYKFINAFGSPDIEQHLALVGISYNF